MFDRNPNIGEPTNVKWDSYMNNRSYLRISTDLITKNSKDSVQSFGVRDDLYKFWFIEMDKNGNCSSYDFDTNFPYESKRHTKGIEPALDRCFDLLNQSQEYNHLREMFLTEYENCMNSIDTVAPQLKNLFNTVCLDVIAVRRMIIEYETCCMADSKEITSTICEFKNFNTQFVGYNLTKLIEYTKQKAHVESKENSIYKYSNRIFVLSTFYLLLNSIILN